MNFLYPGFLFALLSVAIPVIIHLFNFRRFKKIYFSNVQLLKEVEQQHSSREKLKNLLILLTRIVAIIFLVLAFAQPYIPLSEQKNVSLNNVVSVFIDNSYSMETINQDGSLLDEAKKRAQEVVKGFGVNDRFQLLTNDFEGKHQRLLNKEAFIKALEGVKISAASRTLQQIINRQGTLLSGSSNKYSFIISDFQNNMASARKLDTKNDTQYALLKLNATTLPNIGVDSVWNLSPNHQPGGSEKLVVQLRNYSIEPANNIPIKLTINNQQKALSSANISGGKTFNDTLSFSGLVPGWQKGIVSIKDFPITFDDTLSFAFKVDQNLPVLSINGAASGNYVKALFAADPYYQLTENPESSINYNGFAGYKLIILNGLKNPSTGLAQQLATYLKSGGSVVIFPDLDADIVNYNAFLSSLSLPSIQSLVTNETRVDQIDLQNPIFKTVFEEVPKNIDLPVAKRFFAFAENNAANKESILTFPGRKLFLAKFGIGEGAAYLCAIGLNDSDGNLPRHPVFVPVMYRMALNTGYDPALYYHVGVDNALHSSKIAVGKNQTLRLKAPGFDAIPEIRQAGGKTFIYISDQVKQAGFYQLSQADSILAVYAFNAGRSESDLHYLSKPALGKLANQSNFKVFDTEKDPVKLISGNDRIGQTLWKLCLILSLIFIAAEILLIKFFNHPRKTI
ncbi:BatA domain-containing protein [Pedobacter sandarakinus]|uniref:BatA domain-containing protein n=1 Tax=Pedobacter sandarakinus TaxID=353156 RepID=UPI002245182A|nr:BatA domain-containing protein [Pedobacter sandarakinus]MCX2575327.1 BatA domain-containing protein [Pedobacter sandarakinus]